MGASPYVGQLILVGFNFAPAGYLLCEGQLLAISEFETLFQLIGTTYGGNGQTTFALPDLRGRAPVSQGTGPGLSSRSLGETAGTESETLTLAQIPAHTHAVDISGLTPTLRCRNGTANQGSPVGNVPAIEASGATATYSSAAADVNMGAGTVVLGGAVTAATVGGSQPHENRQPYLAMNYCIAFSGVFPPQV